MKLFTAAANGDLDTIKACIEAGISPNIADYDHRTPLHIASSEGRLNAINYLLSKGMETKM